MLNQCSSPPMSDHLSMSTQQIGVSQLPYIVYKSMGQRKAWTEQEDKVLKTLYEEHKLSKWSQIARAMSSEFQMFGRNGKQCRQRYHNHLDNSIKRDKWNDEEAEELITLHNSIGNRWAEISRAIAGRSQNCVKNKFYSILRRGLKYINSAIKTRLKRYKELEIGVIYKIVEACENSYKKKSLTKEMVETLEIKKQVIYYGMNDAPPTFDDYVKVKNLIERIKLFSKGLNIKKEAGRENSSRKDDVSMPSEEVESSEFRDNITDLRTKRTSLHNLVLEPIQQENEEGSETKISLFNNLGKVKKLSSKESNKSFEPHEARPYDLIPIESIKSFELPEFDHAIRSPRPIFYGDSPYFDQLRPSGSFNSWSQFYPQ